MVKKLFALVFLLFGVFSLLIADEIDSLKHLISVLPNDSSKVNAMNELSKQLLNSDPNAAFEIAKQSATIAHQIGYHKGEAYAIKFEGIYYFNSGDNLNALTTWQQSLAIFKSINFKKGIANQLSNIGNIYYNQGDDENGLVYFFQALTIAEEIKDTVRLSTVYINIGSLYSNRPLDYDKAIKYYKLAMPLSISTGDTYIIGNNQMNLGEIYNKKGMVDTALIYFNNAVKNMQGTDGYSYALNSLANAYTSKGDYQKSLQYHQLAFDDAIILDGKLDMATSLRGLGEVYILQKNFQKSRTALLQAAEISTSINAVNELREIYTLLVQVSAQSNNYKEAFVYQQKLMAIKDTIFSTEKDKKLGALQFEFDIDKQKVQIDLLQKDQELNQRKMDQQQNQKRTLIGGVLVLLLVSGFIYRNYRIKHKSNQLILEQKSEAEKQRDEAERQRLRAEQSEKFEQQFLANMSHEIRTPMNAVVGMTNLLIDKQPRPDQLNYLDGIRKSSENLLHIINDILDLSKIEAGKMELEQIDFSVSEVVEQVKQTLQYKAEEKGIEIKLFSKGELSHAVIGDPVRLNQILMNLTGNAIKFTEKGTVTIKILCDQIQNEKQKITFRIEDTGVGIPADKLKTVFESFGQANVSDSRKFGGTGLGLTISKQLVEQYGGNIEIESEPGKGTAFFFSVLFPVGSISKVPSQNADKEIDGSILNGLKILLVDDNEFNRTVARETLLSKSQVEIVEAFNGQEAVHKIETNDFDIVLMDVQMPVMDGLEATQLIRSKFSSPKNQVKIIALTASVIKSDIEQCLKAGMDDFLPKPFKPLQLFVSIANLCSRELKYVSKINPLSNSFLKFENQITDLTFLNDFSSNNQSKIKQYIQMYVDDIPQLKIELNKALANQDYKTIATQLHAFKTRFMMMGMTKAKDFGNEIEQDCIHIANPESIGEKIKLLIEMIDLSQKELESY